MPTNSIQNDSTPQSPAGRGAAAAKRYGQIMRDFMAYSFHDGMKYGEDHVFTDEELGAVTPEHILRFFRYKLYGDGDIDEDETDKSINGSHHTIDYYKKAISSFMPNREQPWDDATKEGNPTRAKSVNEYVRRIRDMDAEKPGKKRGSRSSKYTLPIHSPKKRAVANVGNSSDLTSTILLQMHQQNTSVIDFLGTLGTSINQFKTSMEEKNAAIMANILELQKRSASVPVAAAVATAAATSGTGTTIIQSPARLPPLQPDDWYYDHPDGKRRSVPPSWKFPSGTFLELYIMWHCGDPENRILPMKTFTATDVSFCGKRSRTSLSEARCLVAKLDEAVEKAGGVISPGLSEGEIVQLFQLGVRGLDIPLRTPTGRERNLYNLKWRTLVDKGRKSVGGGEKVEEAEA